MTTSGGVEQGDYKEEFIKECDYLISRYQKFFKEVALFFSEDVFNKKIDAPLIWGRAMRPRWLGDDLERSVNLLARQDVYIYGGDFERFNNIPAMAEVGLSNVFSAKNQCISSGRCNLKYLERSIRCLAELEMFCELSKKYISAIDRRVKKEKSLHGKKAGNKNAVRYDAVREEIKRRVVEYGFVAQTRHGQCLS